MRTKIYDTKLGVGVIFFFLLSGLMGGVVLAQQTTIQGTVTDSETGDPLPGANILVKGTTNGTATNTDGTYKLEVASLQDTLVVTFTGYKTKQIPINGRTKINIQLAAKVFKGEELVVVGMTELEKELVVSSVSQVDVSSSIEGKPITQLSQALQGGTTGINVQQSSGLPGGNAANIKIRGISTLGNTDPLVLVDGVPYDLDDVNPANVKSITILKDAAAASMYGSRGANGVILIKTKRGVTNQLNVNYNAYGGVQVPTYTPDFVGAVKYMKLVNRARNNVGRSPKYSDKAISATKNGTDPIHYPNTNWGGTIFEPYASINKHTLSINGGGEMMRFAVTASYLNQDGIVEALNYEEIKLRANTTTTLGEGLRIRLDLVVNRNNQTQPFADGGLTDNLIKYTYRIPPTIRPRYPKREGEPISYSNYAGEMRNPLAMLEQGGTRTLYDDEVTVNIRPEWNINSNLAVRFQYNFQLGSERVTTYREAYNFINYFTGNLDYTFDNATGSSITQKSTYYFLDAQVEYNWEYNKHQAKFLGGVSQQYDSPDGINIETLRSAYGQVHYSYADKYLLLFSMRYDGSSLFAEGHKWGAFPSVAVGWNVSNEEFMEEVEFINHWKLRASYGIVGNNSNVDPYAYQSTIDPGNGVENRFGNRNITWETVKMLDLGTDIRFNALGLQLHADWYFKTTKDIILYPPVPNASGRGETPINAGKVRNIGWEVKMSWNTSIAQNFNLYGNIGASKYRNEILKLPGGPYFPGDQTHKLGHPIGMYYGFETDGLLQQSDIKSGVPTFPGQQTGDIKYVDINDDGKLTSKDRTIIGNPNSRLNYFVTLGFNYKGFDFEILLNGYGSHTAVLTGMLAAPLNLNAPGSVPMVWQTDFWTPKNTDAFYPRLTPNMRNTANVNRFSDYWFQDAAYARVKYIQIGYSLGPEVLEELNLSKVRFYINAMNPFTITDYPYLDPESTGTVRTYPLMQTYTVGIQLKL